jgi:hypothetical protein
MCGRPRLTKFTALGSHTFSNLQPPGISRSPIPSTGYRLHVVSTRDTAKRVRVAFSFVGEKRDFVAQVAAIRAARFAEAAFLYDKYHEAEFARRDLGLYLPDLYHDQSDLVIVVVCRDYQQKEWCGLEWHAIFALLKKRKDSEVVLCRSAGKVTTTSTATHSTPTERFGRVVTILGYPTTKMAQPRSI